MATPHGHFQTNQNSTWPIGCLRQAFGQVLSD